MHFQQVTGPEILISKYYEEILKNLISHLSIRFTGSSNDIKHLQLNQILRDR